MNRQKIIFALAATAMLTFLPQVSRAQNQGAESLPTIVTLDYTNEDGIGATVDMGIYYTMAACQNAAQELLDKRLKNAQWPNNNSDTAECLSSDGRMLFATRHLLSDGGTFGSDVYGGFDWSPN